jgi:hypothetical protein
MIGERIRSDVAVALLWSCIASDGEGLAIGGRQSHGHHLVSGKLTAQGFPRSVDTLFQEGALDALFRHTFAEAQRCRLTHKGVKKAPVFVKPKAQSIIHKRAPPWPPCPPCELSADKSELNLPLGEFTV